ncbi:MAG: cyclic nucleotide-binding domain-containing protein [Verrucomicrobia bacterium]|nr:cyclic nucleotide-binding domain-containing protein [Verrucomicrobiota bacterium]MCH8514328.1 cyclic nucleotide-binding domain-containing protein [Kiritimatiellia bacterium]
MAEPLSTLTTHEALTRLVARAHAMGREPEEIPEGETLLREGEANDALFILLEGTARMVKRGADGGLTPVDLLGPGSILGILSFWTGRPTFSDSVAATRLRVLRLDQRDFERGVAEDPEFARLTQQLLVANLSDRYRRVVGLNLKVAGLTRELEAERNALREAVADLKQTRNKLVHQEKLATMGQLLAGIAHEINNPSSALMKNVEMLIQEMPGVFEPGSRKQYLLEEGMSANYATPAETRVRMAELQEKYPDISRTQCRRLARLPARALASLEADLGAAHSEALEPDLRVFEIGSALHSIRVAEERITRLVKSLKSYSRQDDSEVRSVHIEDCIRDTLTVLNHRLKQYDVELDLASNLPEVNCRPGEINQILTNLLTNACEATAPGKKISISAGTQTDSPAEMLWIEVSDEGHGIPEALMDKIFEPNITTKSGGGDYGLGLGLAISRDIAVKHQGSLTAGNRSAGGAWFRVSLPVEVRKR